MEAGFKNKIYTLTPKAPKWPQNKVRSYFPKLAPLPFDSVSFGAKIKTGQMKKSSYNSFDYYYLDKTNKTLPLNKFNSMENLQNAAKMHLDEIIKNAHSEASKSTASSKEGKKRIVSEWENAIKTCNNARIKPTVACIILSSIFSDLSEEFEWPPAEYNKEAFEKTLAETEIILQKNKNACFNFNKNYRANLKKKYINEEKIKLGMGENSEQVFWIKIPSEIEDPENYSSNTKKLKAISSDFWCTKEDKKANDAIKTNPFWVYVKNNEAKIGVRLAYGEVFDVQGKYNDGFVPYKHIEEVEKLIEENFLSTIKGSKFPEIKARAKRAKKMMDEIPSAIKGGNYFQIMAYLGLEPKVLKNGLFEISHYNKYPSELDYFKKYGINEENFFENIEKIKGNADFEGSKISSFRNLKEIEGDTNFRDSKITNLGTLERIGGNFNLSGSKITDTGNLEEIGGNLNCFGDFELNNLGNIKRILGNAYLSNEMLDFAHQLETVGNPEFIEQRLASRR